MNIDDSRERMFRVGPSLDGNAQDGLGFADRDPQVPLLIGNDHGPLFTEHRINTSWEEVESWRGAVRTMSASSSPWESARSALDSLCIDW